MCFHFLDFIIHVESANLQFWVRFTASMLFLTNLCVAFIFRRQSVSLTLLYVGFFCCALYSTVQTITTGGFNSPYWYGINVVLIVWFVFIPLSYRNHILHALVFVVQHFGLLIIFENTKIHPVDIAVQGSTVFGVLVIGIFISIINNRSTALIFFNQRALMASEEKYRNLVENATDGIIITQNGKFIFSNLTFIEMCHYSWEELSQLTIFDLVVPSDHDLIKNTHERRMQGKEFRTIYTITGRDKFGRSMPMELNSSTIDYYGKPAAFIIVRDYSQQLKAQEAIRESEERYRTIFNMVGDAILIMSYESGKIVDVNEAACKVYGYTRNANPELKY